jgi:SnoaL-like domain
LPVEDQIPPFALSWGHAAGLVALSRPAPPADLDALVQRQAIVETVQAYGWAIDERRWDVLADVLAEDHRFRGVVAGAARLDSLDGRDALIDWLRAYTDTLDAQLRHCFTNILVTEQGAGEATALAYLTLCSSTPQGTRVASTAFYRVSLRRQDGAWRIAALYTGFDAAF